MPNAAGLGSSPATVTAAGRFKVKPGEERKLTYRYAVPVVI
jgi:hypothetical protein